MVEQSPTSLDRVFGALSDPTRRAMLRRLSGGTRTIGELAEPFDMSFAAAAKHVKVLEQAGLLIRTIEGRSHRCRLAAGPLAAAAKHVKVLEGAGLLSRTIEGRSHRCRIEAGPLAAADRWLAYYERFWSMRLDDLERALKKGSRK